MGGFLDPGNTTPLLAVTEGRPALCNVSSGNILLFSFHICCKICTFLHFSCGLRLRGEGRGSALAELFCLAVPGSSWSPVTPRGWDAGPG